jgi:hypothetical protein
MRLTYRAAVLLGFILLATSIIFPVLFNGPYPHPPGPVLDRDVNLFYRHEIAAQQPEVILLGDSILTKDVDALEFQAGLGLPTYKLDIPGSSSALWYLMIKTGITQARQTPRYLVILFRDTMLTASTFRTTGPYFGLIDKYASPKDVLFVERAYLAALSPAQAALEEYLPLYTYRTEARESIDSGLRYSIPGRMDCDRDCVDHSSAYVLGDVLPDLHAAAIIQAEGPLYTPAEMDFNARVENSFLPEIIRLTGQNGIQLVFVRAPTRIFPDAASEPAELKTYLGELQTYLANQGIPFLDLAWTAEIEDAHFADPHHMTVEGKHIFTGILAEAVEGLIE